MAIEPNTIIKLLFGVPLNPTYEGTLTFADANEQYDYFNSKHHIPLSKQSYQRYDEGSITVNLPIARLYTCDYMMFQNASYDEKWFYAFVTNVEYINDVTTKVYYQIDVMQTWLLGVDWEFDNCFIDREHTNNDDVGSNILPEPFSVGDFVLNKHFKLGYTSEYAMVIAGFCKLAVEMDKNHNIPENPRCDLVDFFGATTESPIAQINNTIYNQQYNYLPFTTESERRKAIHVLQTLLKGNFWKTFNNNVTSVYIIPKAFCGEVKYSNYVLHSNVSPAWSGSETTCAGFGEYEGYVTLEGTYVPVCNKLYTEQFRTIKVKGVNSTEYVLPIDSCKITTVQYGDTSTHKINYKISGGVYGGCGYRFTPEVLNGVYTNALCLDTGNVVDNPFTASEKDRIIGNVLLSVLAGALRGIQLPRVTSKRTENVNYDIKRYNHQTRKMQDFEQGKELRERTTRIPFHYDYNPASAIYDVMGIQGQNMPNIPSVSSTMIDYINDYHTFSVELYTPNSKDILNIDNYLNTFGYASNRVGIPNYNTREKWNYVKTKWCTLKNKRCPTDALVAIKELINNGIMFWHGETNVNNYVLANGKPNSNKVVN